MFKESVLKAHARVVQSASFCLSVSLSLGSWLLMVGDHRLRKHIPKEIKKAFYLYLLVP